MSVAKESTLNSQLSENGNFKYHKELYKPEISKPRGYKSVCSSEVKEVDISDKMQTLCLLN